MINIVSNTVPFDASRLKDLQFWLQADKIPQPLNSPVLVCPDQSIYQNHARAAYESYIETSLIYAPSLRLTKGNVLPSLDYSPGSRYLVTQRPFSMRPCTIIVVGSFIDPSSSVEILNTATFALGGSGMRVIISAASVGLFLSSGNNIFSYSTHFLPRQPYIITITHDFTSNYTLYVNGVFLTSGVASNFGTNYAGNLLIAPNLQPNESISELLFFNAVLSQGEIQTINQYLNRKWAIF